MKLKNLHTITIKHEGAQSRFQGLIYPDGSVTLLVTREQFKALGLAVAGTLQTPIFKRKKARA